MKEKGFAPIIVLFIVAVVAIGVTSATKNSDDVQGILIARGGDDSGSSSSGSSGSSGSGSGESDNDNDNKDDNSSGSGSSGSTETKTNTENGVRIETKTSPTRERTELRFSESERVKTRTEEDRSRVEVRSGGVKVRYELRDGQLKVKVENEEEDENEVENEDEQEEIENAENELEDEDIKIATLSGKLVLTKNKVAASTTFPLFVNPETKQLTVITPAGEKVVAVLPDQAVKNMLAANVISRLSQTGLASGAISGELSSVQDIINLGIRNDFPVYEISGVKEFKLFGFIPVSSSRTAVVSAETGVLITTEQSLLTNIFDLLSP